MFTLRITNFPTATALRKFLKEHNLLSSTESPLFPVGKTEYVMDISAKYDQQD